MRQQTLRASDQIVIGDTEIVIENATPNEGRLRVHSTAPRSKRGCCDLNPRSGRSGPQKGGLAGQRSSPSRTLDGYLLGALLHSPQRKNHPMNPLHWASCRSPLKRYGQPGRYTMCTDPSVMIAPLVMKPLLSLSLMRHASRATSQLHTILIRLRSTLQTQCSVVAQSVTLNTSNPLI